MMYRHVLILTAISLAIPAVAMGQSPVALDVVLSRDSIMIGESLLYNVVVRHDKAWTMIREPVVDFSNFEVTKIRKVEPQSDNNVLREQLEYSITAFNVETIRIGSPRVLLTNGTDTLMASGPPKTIVVLSSLDSSVTDIMPEKPIIPAIVNWWLLALIVLLCLILVGGLVYGVWLLYERRKRRLLSPVKLTEPIRSPEEVALEKLDQLAGEHLPRAGLFKDYHSRISEILRWYIEQKFGIPALESTTSDLINGFRERRVAGEEFQTMLRHFLERCDLVKFAKYIPDTAECDEVMELARTLVRFHWKPAAALEMV